MQLLDVGIPVVVLRQVAVQLSTPTAGGTSDSFIDKAFEFFLGPAHQVQDRGSCPQGHGPHN